MRTSVRDLVQASHVCRHWRDTIVSSPCLWTKFECEDLELTRQHLERSRPFPINVTASSDSDVQAVIALKSGTERFKSLSLHLPLAPLSIVLNQLTDPAPTLEYLCISVDSCGISIPAKFLGGSTPVLKSLDLDQINNPLNFSKFPALTCLTLTTTWGFDMSELFQLFASARLLEVVSVEFSGLKEPIQESQEVISLPEIRSLTFSNIAGEFPTRLLFLLDTPSVEKVMLNISLSSWNEQTMWDFLPSVHVSSLDSLKLDVNFDPCCNLQFSGPGGVVSINVKSGGPRRLYGGLQSRWLGSLEPESFAHVKHLTLRSYNPTGRFDQHSVLELLGTMDGVRSLIAEWCDAKWIVEALSLFKEGRIELFPELESLTFREHVQKGVFPGLRDMARAREGTGFRLNEVSFDRSVPDSDADSLEPYVGRVRRNTTVAL